MLIVLPALHNYNTWQYSTVPYLSMIPKTSKEVRYSLCYIVRCTSFNNLLSSKLNYWHLPCKSMCHCLTGEEKTGPP